MSSIQLSCGQYSDAGLLYDPGGRPRGGLHDDAACEECTETMAGEEISRAGARANRWVRSKERGKKKRAHEEAATMPTRPEPKASLGYFHEDPEVIALAMLQRAEIREEVARLLELYP